MGATGVDSLIGRERELDQMDQLLESMARGTVGAVQPRARVLLIVGDAGVGKTTLASAILARADQLGMAGAEGHCLDLATGTPFRPVVEALRQVVALRGPGAGAVPPPAQWIATD